MLRLNENLGYRPIGSRLTWSRSWTRPLACASVRVWRLSSRP